MKPKTKKDIILKALIATIATIISALLIIAITIGIIILCFYSFIFFCVFWIVAATLFVFFSNIAKYSDIEEEKKN